MKTQITITIDDSKILDTNLISAEDLMRRILDKFSDAVDYGYWTEYLLDYDKINHNNMDSFGHGIATAKSLDDACSVSIEEVDE